MSDIQEFRQLLLKKEFDKFDELIKTKNALLNYDKNIIFNLIGYRYLQEDKLDLAELNFKNALSHKETFDILTNLGAIKLKKKEFKEAEEYFEQSIKLNPSFSDNYIFLAKGLIAQEKFDQTTDILKKGSEFSIPNDKVLKSFARISLEIKEYDLAIALYSKVLKKFPRDYFAFNNLGASYEAINQFDLAKKNYKKSIELNPNFVDGLCNYANLLRSEGDFLNAETIFLKALKFTNSPVQIYRYLSVIHKFKEDQDPLLIDMLNYANSHKDSEKNIYELYFAIYKAYEDLKDISNSIKYLELANNSKRSSLNYSNDHQKIHFDMMKDVFKSSFDIDKKIKKTNPRAIFIVGMPRSGTTLIEQIISSHPDVVSGGELFYLQKYIKKYFPDKETNLFKSSVLEKLEDFGPRIAENYNEEISKISKNKLVTDKLPFNFIFIGLIKSIFKDVKIIHCKRSPMETCFSIYKNYFPFDELGFAYDQNELGEYYNLYSDLMLHWKKLYKNEIYEIEYENLINNNEIEIRNLIDYCDLEWNDKCLNFYQNKNVVKTLSTNQVRQPIYNTSLNSWKKYEKYLEPLNEILKSLSLKTK